MDEQQLQRRRQFVDRDLMTIAMSQWGMSAIKAATEIVGKVNYQTGDNGVLLVTYGDVRSPVGEAFLRKFVQDVIETYPAAFDDELYARAKERNAREPQQDTRSKPSEISAQRLAELKNNIRGSL